MMSFPVLCQTGVASKSCWAVATFVGSLTCMQSEMDSEVIFASKRGWAKCTLERLFTCMHCHVKRNISPAEKPFATHITLKMFAILVMRGLDVSFQVMLGNKCLFTLRTLERSFTFVNARNVFPEIIRAFQV